MELTGAQALIKSLEAQGVEVVFGLPGGAILPVYDPIIDSSIRHVLVRHEQGAGHAAEGYAQVTGRAGVAMVTSGPGATNIVTALANAMMDSTPLVVVTGQVATTAIGTDAFQEVDTTGITMGVTKHNWLVTDPADIAQVVAEAFHVATTGRPGPVLIDFPKDVANARVAYEEPGPVELPGYRPPAAADPAAVEAAARLVLEAERPVVYAGGGLVKAGAAEALRAFVELTGIPVVSTLMARGVLDEADERFLGMPGMHGSYTAVTALQRADLLLAFGARFDDRVTGRLDAFAPAAKVVHVEVDRAEIDKVRRADVAVHADARAALEALTAALRRLGGSELPGASRRRLGPWMGQLNEWKERFPLTYEREGDGAAPAAGTVKPQQVVEELRRLTPDDTVLVSGVGQHQMWAAQFWQFRHPRQWVNSGGLGTMGFAVPAAVGAKVGRPDAMVWAVDGDGCFQMTAQELVTASAERIPVKVAILNNAYLGMVRQWQHMFYEERYSEVYLSPNLPDYVGWAEAMGCVGLRVSSPEEVAPAIEKANDIDDRPVVIDFRTDSMEQVFPMVPAGASNDDIVVHPSQSGLGR
ncbi:MAG: biosynthetic-type acetolactate synthase large subunit [Actinomycetota bacterium]|nr:biosynthetic-type acetolactate synthase large subunit [Actinomycetota bacterium]